MRQDPVPFLLWAVGSMISSTRRILTAANGEREPAQTVEGGYRASRRGGYLQPLSTLPALLVKGNEETLLRCSRTRMLSCHRFFPKRNCNVQASFLIWHELPMRNEACTCSLSEKSLPLCTRDTNSNFMPHSGCEKCCFSDSNAFAQTSFAKYAVQWSYSAVSQSNVADHSTNALFPSTIGVTRSVTTQLRIG
jgi:hypothetical protein